MNRYVASVLGAGFFWGFIGLFSRQLSANGIDSDGAVVVRCGISAVCFGIYILCTDYKNFIIKLKDAWCFIGAGIFSLLCFSLCYFRAVEIMDLSTAAILLYTAPIIVTLLSAILFKERMTPFKILAVALTFIGCALVSGVGSDSALSFKGLVYGLGSGIGYALYTIFSRYALQRGYNSNTINFYAGLLAALGAAVILRPGGLVAAATSSFTPLFWCIMTGAVSCFLPFLLFANL